MSSKITVFEYRFARSCLAAVFLAAVYFAFDPIERVVYGSASRALKLHMVIHGEMELLPYATLMIVRVILDLLVVALVFAILPRRVSDFDAQ